MCVCVCVCVCLSLGVYLSRYSDLIQVNPITPGVTGEIVIFKVMKVNQEACQSGDARRLSCFVLMSLLFLLV